MSLRLQGAIWDGGWGDMSMQQEVGKIVDARASNGRLAVKLMQGRGGRSTVEPMQWKADSGAGTTR